MPKLINHVPKYCRHRASGQAYVSLEGRPVYLGRWNSAASKAEYDRMIAEWIAAGRQLPADPQAVTIAEIAAAFRRHAKSYYRDQHGTPSKALTNIDESLRPVLKLYSNTAAAEFGPLRLKAVRETMIAAGNVRSNINRHVTRIRGVFKWAVENELIPASVYHGLIALQGLRIGRSGAKESEPVKPVAIADVEAVTPVVSAQVATMIRLQLLTGMRPGEVVLMRGGDIDTTGKLWLYHPHRHKSAHHGHAREIYLGPRAQDLIRPFLKSDINAYLFSPAEAEANRRAALHAQRKTPLSCGNRPGSKRRRGGRTVGNVYTVTAYYRAIIRGCDAAFPTPPELVDAGELTAWRIAHRWHPHQLRHTAGTELRKQHGVEAAQVILGHKRLSTTEIYAEKNVETARKIMAAVG